MTHEPECDDFQNDNVDGLCICQRLRDAYQRGREDQQQVCIADSKAQALEMVDPWMDGYKCGRNDAKKSFMRLIRNAYQRGREDAAKAVEALEGITVTGDHRSIYGAVLKLVASDAARGAQPHQGDTNEHPDSQRFRYGFGNNVATVGNTILDDSDDEKVVAGDYVDNVDAGDTPQPATTWVGSPLQSAEVDTPNTGQSEPINNVVRTVSPVVALHNPQDEERFVSLRICGPGSIDEAVPGPSESDYMIANVARILDDFPKAKRTLSVQVLIKQIRDAIGAR